MTQGEEGAEAKTEIAKNRHTPPEGAIADQDAINALEEGAYWIWETNGWTVAVKGRDDRWHIPGWEFPETRVDAVWPGGPLKPPTEDGTGHAH